MRNKPLIEKGSVFGQAVCEALGLSSSRVHAIHIAAEVNEVLVVTADVYMTAEELEAAREMIISHVGRVVLNGTDRATGEEATEEWEFAE